MTLEISEAAKIRMQLHDVFALLAGAGTPAIRADREAADTTTEMGNPEVAPDCRPEQRDCGKL